MNKQPNLYTINLLNKILIKLIPYSIFPDRISATVEEGICLVFLNMDRNENLYIELYNNKEIGYIINNYKQKRIIENEDIKNFEDIIKIVLRFKGIE